MPGAEPERHVEQIWHASVRLEQPHSLGQDKFINFIQCINFCRHLYCACWFFFLFTNHSHWCLVLRSRYLFLEENDCIAIRGLFTPDIEHIPNIFVSSAVWAHFSLFFFFAAHPPASGGESGDVCRPEHVSIPAVNIAEDWSDQYLFLLSWGQRVACPEWDLAGKDISEVCKHFFYLLSSPPGSNAYQCGSVLIMSAWPGSHRSKLRVEIDSPWLEVNLSTLW